MTLSAFCKVQCKIIRHDTAKRWPARNASGDGRETDCPRDYLRYPCACFPIRNGRRFRQCIGHMSRNLDPGRIGEPVISPEGQT
jgi:hypothetical protein